LRTSSRSDRELDYAFDLIETLSGCNLVSRLFNYRLIQAEKQDGNAPIKPAARPENGAMAERPRRRARQAMK